MTNLSKIYNRQIFVRFQIEKQRHTKNIERQKYIECWKNKASLNVFMNSAAYIVLVEERQIYERSYKSRQSVRKEQNGRQTTSKRYTKLVLVPPNRRELQRTEKTWFCRKTAKKKTGKQCREELLKKEAGFSFLNLMPKIKKPWKEV